MKQILLLATALVISMRATAQGGNVGMGGKEGDFESLSQRVANLEKKNDAFNVYLNYAASAQALYDGNEWSSKIANKQLRLEIKGNITPKLFYRLRHRMNKGNSAQTEDNFARATDIMMVGYHFNDKFTVMAGKMCQIWGGHEFDENPMYIYQYSDMVDNMDNFMAGGCPLLYAHAYEVETSVMMHYHPEYVDLGEAGPGQGRSFRLEALRDHAIWMPRNWGMISPADTGVGDPRLATAEKGRRFAEAVVERYALFLRDLADIERENDLYV